MELTPFTLDEATEIWDDFEDLKDTEFNLGAATEYFVHDVVICPFPEGERVAFMALYDTCKDGKTALEAYPGDEYDVLIVACDVTDESVFTYISIRSFAAEKGIAYDFFQHS